MPQTNETRINVRITPNGVDLEVQSNSKPPTKDPLPTRGNLPALTEIRLRSPVKRFFKFLWNTFFE